MLPVDITFVDKDYGVKFFNKAEKRIREDKGGSM
ncbi:MAG: hypothetical protein ACP5PQ_07005 [Thermoproteota archaeon]